jgi:hypothetical protein
MLRNRHTITPLRTEVILLEENATMPEWATQLQAEHPTSAKVIDAMVRSGDSEATVRDWLDWME